MLPVVILLMAVSFWAFQLYDTKLTAMKDVRGPVFTQATHGCGNPGNTSYTPPQGDSEPPKSVIGSEAVGSVQGSDLSVVGRKLPGAPGGDLVNRGVGGQGGSVVHPFVANGMVGGMTTNLSGNASMTCNEAVKDGDSKGMKKVSGNSFDPRSL
jgi:hypothetical protein